MADHRYVVVDVFTQAPLTGNQLAVFTDARGLDAETMQALALEIGFSETVFVLPSEQGGTARIRIFNPKEEMAFAGHPVLGTAFVLGAPLQRGVVELETGAGIVPVTLERDERGGLAFGRMRQPVPTVAAADEGAALSALGVERSLLPVEVYDNGVRHVVVTLGSEAAVAALAPDLAAVAAFGLSGGINAIAGSGGRWRSRMFWTNGEDAASGSAAGPIACHLARHGAIGWGEEIVILQGVEMGRPSTLHARADGRDGAIEAVEVGGAAVVVARGAFRL